MSTITSANSSLTLSVPDVFAVAQPIQGYAADDAFTNEAIDSAEALMGVDGIMSAGFTPAITKFSISLQADSPSVATMDTIIGAMKAAKEVFPIDASVVLPSVGKVYTLTKGYLTKVKQLSDAKKVLQPVQYEISFESVVSANA